MTYDDLLVLIPSHSLEDFPTELGEKPAEGLLNPFAVVWHPVLLAAAQRLPRWQRADDNLPVQPNRLVIVPTKCSDQVPDSWIERARREGMNVITGITDRQAMLDAALAPLERVPAVDPDLAADFLAFGHIYIQTELLTRHMRNFSHLDEPHLEREIVAAAKAACSQDGEAARKYLRHCFEMLLECRERFYPVECFLLDLCLVIPRLGGEKLQKLLETGQTINLMVTAADLEQIAVEHPESLSLLREGVAAGQVELVGGEYQDLGTPLLDIDTVIDQLSRGRKTYERLLGRTPGIWGRRRYGVSRQMPQLLDRSGFTGAFHLVMDDGYYPDEEQSKLRWEGADGSTLDAYSRIPLAGDSASSYLRMPVRIAESMDHDHVAGVAIARWPEMRTPWLEDLKRGEKYAAVLGKFTTLSEFFTRTEHPGRHTDFPADKYLTPFFVQSVAKQEAHPIGRYIDWWARQSAFKSAAWVQTMAAALWGRPWPGDLTAVVDAMAKAHPDAEESVAKDAQGAIDQLAAAGRSAMTEVFSSGSPAGGAAAGPGWLLLNPLAVGRKVCVELPGEARSAADPATRVVQKAAAGAGSVAVVDIPSCGFAWVPAGSSAPAKPASRDKSPPMAEGLTLRNEFFEVHVSETTGGISQVRTYHRSPNRVSQQLAFRFPRERTLTIETEGEEPQTTQSFYSEMRSTAARVLAAGPAMGAIETFGEIVDQQTNVLLADFRQEIRVYRGKPIIELLIELKPSRKPEGDPWSNYFCSRFAWKDSSAALTRSMQMGASPVGEQERIEAPHYVEIADEKWRTTILGCGLPFHRLTGDRMLDTILIAEGESRTSFRMVIAVDDQYPLQAALDAMTPPVVLRLEQGPPAVGESGWLVHIGTKNVVLLGIHPLHGDQGEDLSTAAGFAVRLLETEGRSKVFKLRLFKPAKSARQRDFRDHTVQTLHMEGDAVVVHVSPHEVCEVEVTF